MADKAPITPAGMQKAAMKVREDVLKLIDDPKNDLGSIRPVAHVPYNDGCCFYRLYQPLTYLQATKQIPHFDTTNVLCMQEWIANHPRPYNIIINQRILGPYHIALAKAYHWMYLLECDDDYWNITKKNPAYQWIKERPDFLPNYARIIPKAYGVIVSTAPLAQKFRDMGAQRVWVVPNGIDYDYMDMNVERNNTDRVRLGWIGSKHHVDDMEQVVNVIKALKVKYSNLDVIFMGWCPDQLKDHVTYVNAVNPTEFQAKIKTLALDIAIAPLVDSIFNRSKSNLKWLEYSSLRIPTVVSDVFSYREVIHGVTGFKVKNQNEWTRCLSNLIENPELRKRIGSAAREWCSEYYDLSVTTSKLLCVLGENLEAQRKIPDIKERLDDSQLIYRATLNKVGRKRNG